MSGKPSRAPQSKEEMITAAKAKRSTQMYRGRSDTMEANSQKVSQIVTIAATGLRNQIEPDRRVQLSDTEAIQTIAMNYLAACAEASIVPTLVGFAAATGHSRHALYAFLKGQPTHPSSKFIRSFTDMCAEVVMQNALAGSVQAIPAIFNLKSRFGWSEDGSGVPGEPEEKDIDAEAIMAKYADMPDDERNMQFPD